MIRVQLPFQLRELARVAGEATLDVGGVATMHAVIDALEAKYPALKGTIRDPEKRSRRAYLRYFACSEDWSDEPLDAPLPEPIQLGAEPLLVVGAVSGG